MLVDLTAVAARVRDDFIALFTAKAPLPPGAAEWWYAHFGPMKESTVDPTKLEGLDEMRRRVIQATPLEDRLAGLTPEQRLAGVPESEQLLALSPHLLQQLPEEYVASLPTDVQARVRTRRGR